MFGGIGTSKRLSLGPSLPQWFLPYFTFLLSSFISCLLLQKISPALWFQVYFLISSASFRISRGKKNRRLNIKGCSCCSVTVDCICSIERELSPFSLCFLYWFTNITHQVAYLPLLYPFSSNWRRYI